MLRLGYICKDEIVLEHIPNIMPGCRSSELQNLEELCNFTKVLEGDKN